jgi:hypothetical protein
VCAGTAVNHSVECIRRGSQSAAQNATAIHTFRGQRLILKDTNPFARIENFGIATRQKRVLHRHLSFLNDDNGSGILIFNADVENCAAHGNDRSGRADFVVIGLPADFLDLDFYTAEKYFQKILPVPGIIAENYAGIGENLEGAAVGDLKNGITFSTGDDDLFR